MFISWPPTPRLTLPCGRCVQAEAPIELDQIPLDMAESTETQMEELRLRDQQVQMRLQRGRKELQVATQENAQDHVCKVVSSIRTHLKDLEIEDMKMEAARDEDFQSEFLKQVPSCPSCSLPTASALSHTPTGYASDRKICCSTR